MSTAYDEPRRLSGLTLERQLADHGVPAEYLGAVMDALVEMVPHPRTVAPTEAEFAFVRAAGIDPDEVFSPEAERSNRLYEAVSEVIIERELRDSVIPTSEVARLMGKDPAHVRRMLADGRLMTAGQVDGQSAFPRWQFADGEPLPGLKQVLAAFPGDYHPLDIEKVMTTPVEELGGRSPRDWLATGGAAGPVIAVVTDLSYL